MSRTLWPLAALAVLAMLGAGCSSGASDSGNGGSGGSNPGATADPHAQAVQFAQCMRTNGVNAFPDPDASGSLTIDEVANGSSIDTSSAAFTNAITACKDLEPAGFTGTTRTPEQQAAALKFAQCMRDNGIKDFPDPTADGPLIDTSRMPGSPGAQSIPGFKAAQDKCSQLATDAGVKGP
ncbi:MAG TPA: hypothetical protein VFY10_01625 [Dehalococcoidia bacterium]|nr:hypothetical protein [Dehalococcoidia bacterium]